MAAYLLTITLIVLLPPRNRALDFFARCTPRADTDLPGGMRLVAPVGVGLPSFSLGLAFFSLQERNVGSGLHYYWNPPASCG